MLRKLFTFSVVLVASITLSNTRITAQQRGGQPSAGSLPGNSQPSPTPKAVPESDNDADKRQSETNQKFDQIAAEVRSIREHQAAIETRQADKKSEHGPPIWSNWFLFGAAVAAAVAAVLTLRRIKDEIELTRSLLTTAQRQAVAAEKSAKVAERTMFLSLRARMGLKSIEANAFGAMQDASFTFVFENFGGKGAMLDDYCVALSHDPLPRTPVYGDFREIGTPIERGGTYTIFLMLNPPLSKETWAEILREGGQTKLTIYGVLRYKAGFGSSQKSVGFRREYDPKMSRYRNRIEFNATGGAEYNYAD